jgi:hypothetical protein
MITLVLTTASFFLLLGGRVFAVGNRAGVTAGGLAGLIERNPRPLTDADHAAGDPATASWAVLEPERLRAAGKNADAEALGQCVPEKFLLLLRPELGYADQRLGQLFGFCHRHTFVSVPVRSDSPSTAPDAIRTLRRDTAHYGGVCR